MSKPLLHYFKSFIIFLGGNLWRATFQALFNVVRYFYDWFKLLKEFGIIDGIKQYFYLKKQAKETLWTPTYEYDGLGAEDGLFQKFPTYTKCLSGFAHNNFHGNCMDYAHAIKQRFKTSNYGKKLKLRIYIPEFNLYAVHYLLEVTTVDNKVKTYHLVGSGQKVEDKTAKEVMGKIHPDKTIFRIW